MPKKKDLRFFALVLLLLKCLLCNRFAEAIAVSRINEPAVCTKKYNGLFSDSSPGGAKPPVDPCVYPYRKPGSIDCNRSSPLFSPYELKECWVSRVDIGKEDAVNKQALFAILEELDKELTNQRIKIVYQSSVSDASRKGQRVAEWIDEYLSPRPWWDVLKEHHAKHKHEYSNYSIHDYTNEEREHDSKHAKMLEQQQGVHQQPQQSSFSSSVADTTSYVILDRYHYKWENYLRYHGKRQYPSSNTVCMNSLLVVGRSSCVHPGWGSVTRQFNLLQKKVRYGIFMSYYPANIEDNGRSAYISLNKRKNYSEGANAWDQAFLSSTNCSVPDIVKACVKQSCLSEESPDFYMGLVLSPAAANNSSMRTIVDTTAFAGDHSDIPPGHVILQLGEKAVAAPELEAMYKLASNVPVFHSIAPREKSILKKFSFPYSGMSVDVDEQLFKFKVLLRPNAFYREKIDRLIHTLRHKSSSSSSSTSTPSVSRILKNASASAVESSSETDGTSSASARASKTEIVAPSTTDKVDTPSGPHFPAGTPCVAVHIRRGDRARVDINISELCFNMSHDESELEKKKERMGAGSTYIPQLRGCKNEFASEELTECPSVIEGGSEYACLSIPFGAVTLKHVTDRMHLLVEDHVKDIVLFSEDQLFLQNEITKLRKTDPQWNVHILPVTAASSTNSRSSSISRGIKNGRVISSSIDHYHNNLEILKAQNELSDYVRSGGGTESGVNFMATLKMAQQCSAFMGHFGSSMTEMIYNAMCVQHAGTMGLCPPFYNIEAEYKD